MRRLAVWFLFATMLSSSPALAETGFLDRSVAFSGEAFSYKVYVPQEWTNRQSWPVILYLHDNGRQGRDNLRQLGGPGLVAAIIANQSRFPAVVVFPQAREGTGWGTPAMQDMALRALDATVAEFNGDPSRVYLTGFSLGGVGVWRMGWRWPTKFAALVAVAGRAGPNPGWTSQRLAEEVAAAPYLVAPNPFDALAERIKNVPIRIFHGDADQTIPVEAARPVVVALEQAGAPDARYVEYPSATHGGTADKAFGEMNGLMEWLFSQRLRK